MRQTDPAPLQPSRRACPEQGRRARAGPCRRDGWTAARQLAFLTILAQTRSVSRAAAATGMSRESAYRLRARDPDGLFALLWKRAMQPRPGPRLRQVDQGHRPVALAAPATEGKGRAPKLAARSTS